MAETNPFFDTSKSSKIRKSTWCPLLNVGCACNTAFFDAESLGNHVRKSHPSFPCDLLNEVKPRGFRNDIWFQCDVCRLCYQGLRALQNHSCHRSLTHEDMASLESAALSTELLKHSLEPKVVPGDGNCFFRAIADQISPDDADHDHDVLRASVSLFMTFNIENYRNNHVGDDNKGGVSNTFEQYLLQLQLNGTHVNEIVIQGTADYLNGIIILSTAYVDHSTEIAKVFTASYISNCNSTSHNFFYVVLQTEGVHYNSVRKIGSSNNFNKRNRNILSKHIAKIYLSISDSAADEDPVSTDSTTDTNSQSTDDTGENPIFVDVTTPIVDVTDESLCHSRQDDDKIDSANDSLNEALLNTHLEQVVMPADGNSFFHSLHHQLTKIQGLWGKHKEAPALKASITNHILANLDIYQQFHTVEDIHELGEAEEYIRRLQLTNQIFHINSMVLMGAAHYLNRNIYVITSNSKINNFEVQMHEHDGRQNGTEELQGSPLFVTLNTDSSHFNSIGPLLSAGVKGQENIHLFVHTNIQQVDTRIPNISTLVPPTSTEKSHRNESKIMRSYDSDRDTADNSSDEQSNDKGTFQQNHCMICNYQVKGGIQTMCAHIQHKHAFCDLTLLQKMGMVNWVKCEHCKRNFKGKRGIARHLRHCTGQSLDSRYQGSKLVLQQEELIPASSTLLRAGVRAVAERKKATDYFTWAESEQVEAADDFERSQSSTPIEWGQTTANDLMNFYNRRLDWVRRDWCSALNKITKTCLQKITDTTNNDITGIVALLILPGWVQHHRQKHRPQLGKILGHIASQADPAQVLCNIAKDEMYLEENQLQRQHTKRVTTTPTQSSHRRQEQHEDSYNKVIKKIEDSVDVYRCSNAMRIIEAKKTTIETRGRAEDTKVRREMNDIEFSEEISRLFPQATENDIIPDNESNDPEGLVLNSKGVEGAIRKLVKGVANGCSGWTNQSIQAIFLNVPDEQRDATIDQLTAFYNMCTKGKLHAAAADIFGRSRAILLDKPDKSYRPIGIGEALYRLMGRAIGQITAEDIGRKVAPIQMALGTKCGGEIMARILQLIYDMTDDMAIIRFDIQNAYNSLRRNHIWEGLKTYCPQLCRTFRTFYGRPSDLRRSTGAIVGRCSTGVKQGDSLSLIFFVVGFQVAVLTPLQNKLNERMHKHSLLNPTMPQIAHLLSFSDDGSVAAPRVVCEELCIDAADICQKAGLVLVREKSTIVGRGIDETYETDRCIFPHVVGGVKVVGCPVGSEQYRKHYLCDKVQKRIACLNQLTQLNSQTAYILTHKCVNARLAYLTRIMEGSFVKAAWTTFDLAIDEAVATIAGTTASEEIRTLRVLPQMMGGLGMMAYDSIPGEKGKFESRNITREYMQKYSPLMLEASYTWEEHCPSSLGNLIARLSEWNGGCTVTVEEAVKEQEMKQLHSLQTQLSNKKREGALAWLCAGATKSGARWMFWRGGNTKRFRLTHQQFRDALRMRLLLPMAQGMEGSRVQCQCAKEVSEDEWYHMLTCPQNSWFTVQRHNQIRDLLVDLIKTTSKRKPVIKIEPFYHESTGRNRKADIEVRTEDKLIVIDVEVVNPASIRYRKQSQAIPEKDHATKQGERKKKHDFRHVDEPELIKSKCFVPFVMDATGRLGPAAKAFIDAQTSNSTQERTYFLNCLAASTAVFNSRAYSFSRGKAEFQQVATSNNNGDFVVFEGAKEVRENI